MGGASGWGRWVGQVGGTGEDRKDRWGTGDELGQVIRRWAGQVGGASGRGREVR